jgi:hypothetical protein
MLFNMRMNFRRLLFIPTFVGAILNRPLACRQGQIRIVFSELGFAELDVGKC